MRTRKGFKTVRGAMLALAMMLMPVYYGACATVQAGWVSDPIPAMTASVMSAKPCSPPAFRDPAPNVNRQNGWSSVVKPGASMPICAAAETPYICDSASGCGEFTVGTKFVGNGRGKRHVIVDLMRGKIKACLQPSQRFGIGSLECVRKSYSAENGPVRIILESEPADVGTSPELATFISAEPGSPVVIGQIAPVEAN